MFKTMLMTATITLAAGAAATETHEIRMLDRGEAGMMVFEPAFVMAEPGDVIRFLPSDKGHNVEHIGDMLPDGVEGFRTAFNEEFDLTVGEEGLYGVKCTPHYAMGMVALIQVGAPVNLEAAEAVPQKGKAKARMAELIARVE